MLLTDTLQGKTTKRPPIWFMRQAGRVLPTYRKLREKYSFETLMKTPELAAQVTLLPINDLEVDAAILFSDILVIPEALGMQLCFSDKGPVFETALKNVKNPIDSLVFDENKLSHIYEAIDQVIATKPLDIPLIGFCGAPFTTFCYMIQGISSKTGFPEAVQMIYKNPEKSFKILQKITESSIQYANSQIKHGIDVFQIFESHTNLLPYSFYLKNILPFVKQISDTVRKQNIPVIFFPKGIGEGVYQLDHTIADCISIDWHSSLHDIRQRIDPKLVLQGNLDPRLLYANKTQIEKILQEYLAFGKKHNSWIFNLGHGFCPDTPYENAKFVVDWMKNKDWER